jgi:hypothetical protein
MAHFFLQWTSALTMNVKFFLHKWNILPRMQQEYLHTRNIWPLFFSFINKTWNSILKKKKKKKITYSWRRAAWYLWLKKQVKGGRKEEQKRNPPVMHFFLQSFNFRTFKITWNTERKWSTFMLCCWIIWLNMDLNSFKKCESSLFASCVSSSVFTLLLTTLA